MKQFLVVLLLAITAVCFVLTEKKQNKVPDKAEAVSWEMKVVDKDQLPYLPEYKLVDSVAKQDSIRCSTHHNSIVEEKVLPCLVKKTKISNSDIQEMVDLLCELNWISNPNLIYPGQPLLCRFPDNKHFEFYEDVLPGQSLWTIVKYLLEVTSNYHPVYYSHPRHKK